MYSVQAWEVERMSMLQIGILGVAGVLLALQFKSGKSEYGIYISIALGMLIFASLLGKISLLKDVLNEVSNVVGLNSDYFKTLWKILGITYAAEFSSAICKDAGYQTYKKESENNRLCGIVFSVSVFVKRKENAKNKKALLFYAGGKHKI